MGRSKHSGGKWDDKPALNLKGEESEQSKERRKKRRMNETAEGLVEGMRENRGRMPTKGTELAKKVRDYFKN